MYFKGVPFDLTEQQKMFKSLSEWGMRLRELLLLEVSKTNSWKVKKGERCFVKTGSLR